MRDILTPARLLLVVDMQNDFIDGALANPAAQKIVTPIADFIRTWEGDIAFTMDGHSRSTYAKTEEGKRIPPHCFAFEHGSAINSEIMRAATESKNDYVLLDKATFGFPEFADNDSLLAMDEIDLNEYCKEVVICGTCTDICVLTNALLLRTGYPSMKITVQIVRFETSSRRVERAAVIAPIVQTAGNSSRIFLMAASFLRDKRDSNRRHSRSGGVCGSAGSSRRRRREREGGRPP